MKKKIAAIIVFILLALSTMPIYAVDSAFNLKDYIEIPIKDQRGTGSCWTLAMSTVFETNLALKRGIKYEISARHMDYATSQSFTNGATNPLGFAKEVDTGGTAEVALAYLTNGSGPIPESEMPFSTRFGDIDISEIQGKSIDYQVKKWVQFPCIIKNADGTYEDDEGNQYTNVQIQEIRNQIKQHITQNGAVYAGINAAEGFTEYYNQSTYAYNCNDYNKKTDHAVAIIGWDDNYSRNNFKSSCRPSQNGAYIVQNSWGNDSRLNNGTFYISYEDAIVETGVYGIVDIAEKSYTKLYQYDELGRNQYFNVSGLESAYAANVFQREQTPREVITQVGITTYMPVDCEIYINPANNSLTVDNLIKVAETRLTPGYNTVDLGYTTKLSGKKFAVVVKYKKIGDILGITTVARYADEPANNPYIYMTSNRGEGYLGISMSNLRELQEYGFTDTNICIKAFTNVLSSGDINGDGKITAMDLSLLMCHIVNISKLKDTSNADINNDGKISALDLSLLMQIMVKLI